MIQEHPANIICSILFLPEECRPANLESEMERLKASFAHLSPILRTALSAYDECCVYKNSRQIYDVFLDNGGNLEAIIDMKQCVSVDEENEESLTLAVNTLIGRFQADKVMTLIPEMKRGKITVNDLASLIPGSDNIGTPDIDTVSLHAAIANYRTRGSLRTVGTGFNEVDNITGGLARGRFTVLAARPGVGKSSFALAVAVNNIRAGRKVVLASAEMDRGEIVKRLDRCCGNELDKLPNYMTIMDGPSQAVSRIARTAIAEHPDLVIVDYLGILDSGPDMRRHTEYEQVTALSGQIRVASKGMMGGKNNAPAWLVLSQLNRGSTSERERPTLANLRASGAIEQDAYGVLFMWEPEERRNPDTERKVNVTIAKNRGGGCGEVAMQFRTYTGKWEEMR